MTTHVLILGTHNAARSVLAEGMLDHWARALGKDVQAHSAGSAPGGVVSPFALQALAQAGVDTTDLRSKSWDEFTGPDAPPLSLVITVCDSAAGEPWPLLHGGKAGAPLKVHWAYPDPSSTRGEAARRRAFELTRQAIGFRMLQLLHLPLEAMSKPRLQHALAQIAAS